MDKRGYVLSLFCQDHTDELEQAGAAAASSVIFDRARQVDEFQWQSPRRV
jgi:hypothetical protein